ncbi:MAG: addiction module protein [Thermoleophilia bacterium]|nr:addiction module protein [Thermoleophilia bacterium]
MVTESTCWGRYVEMKAENRHVVFDPARPYDALPSIPPARMLETRAVLKASIDARDALTKLGIAAARLPNAAIVINAIPLLEARDSSRIENIVTTSDELFQHQDGTTASTDPATKEALRYRTALLAGFASLRDRPVSTRTAIEVVGTLLGTETDVRKITGTTLRDGATGDVLYTPPSGESRIRELLADWERFLHDDDIDVLVRMAASHYQFEAIHPFHDGNGRTGRIVNTLVLVQHGVLDEPILYLSRYILDRRDQYYRLLRAVTVDDAWEPWLRFMLEGVRSTAEWTASLVAAILELLQETDQLVRAQLPKVHSHELIQLLFTYPYARIGNLVDAGIAKRQTASTYLQQLAGIGVLAQRAVGRERIYLNTKLLALLEGGFASTA